MASARIVRSLPGLRGADVKRFWAFLLFASPALAVSPPRVDELMQGLSGRAEAVEKSLKEENGPAAVRDLEGMADLFERVRELHAPSYGGDPREWIEDCARSRVLALSAREAVLAGRWPDAREGFAEIMGLQKEAHRVFRPTLFQRIGRWFKKKPAEPTGNVPNENQGAQQP